MRQHKTFTRRVAVKSSVFGFLAVTLPNLAFAREMVGIPEENPFSGRPHARYPSIPDDLVSEVVGVSHFNLERLKELVNPRPELARATWDWAFGDWETAIGAASHVGRRDIVDYLLRKGARPDIFTYAMLGDYNGVKAMVECSPGVQRTKGPHGISLLQHARTGLRSDGGDKANAQRLIDYLEGLGDADGRTYEEVTEADKVKYLGDYLYGDGPEDGFTVKLNMRKMLSLGRLGNAGGALYKLGKNRFMYNGVPSVEVTFEMADQTARSLTVHEPGLTLKARKTG